MVETGDAHAGAGVHGGVRSSAPGTAQRHAFKRAAGVTATDFRLACGNG